MNAEQLAIKYSYFNQPEFRNKFNSANIDLIGEGGFGKVFSAQLIKNPV